MNYTQRYYKIIISSVTIFYGTSFLSCSELLIVQDHSRSSAAINEVLTNYGLLGRIYTFLPRQAREPFSDSQKAFKCTSRLYRKVAINTFCLRYADQMVKKVLGDEGRLESLPKSFESFSEHGYGYGFSTIYYRDAIFDDDECYYPYQKRVLSINSEVFFHHPDSKDYLLKNSDLIFISPSTSHKVDNLYQEILNNDIAFSQLVHGKNPLMFIRQDSCIEKFITKYCQEVFFQDSMGNTVFHYISHKKGISKETLEIIFAKCREYFGDGQDGESDFLSYLNLENKCGLTPLQDACRHSSIDFLEFFLSYLPLRHIRTLNKESIFDAMRLLFQTRRYSTIDSL